MVTKVQSWGNSQGLRLSKQILADAHVSVGDDVDVAVRDGVIVVTPVKRTRGKSESPQPCCDGFRKTIGRKKPTGERRLGGRSGRCPRTFPARAITSRSVSTPSRGTSKKDAARRWSSATACSTNTPGLPWCVRSRTRSATSLSTLPSRTMQSLTGFIMVEQLKSIDFRARRARRIACASDAVMDEVLSILDACIY